jgi:hypothetical protein
MHDGLLINLFQINEQPETDPNEDIDTENGQCCCGEYDCKDSYVHWTSGY